MSKVRYLVKGQGDDKQAMLRALSAGIELLSEIDDLVIVVPTIGHMKDTMFAKLLYEKVPGLAKSFFKDRIFHLPEGKKIQLCASTTLRDFSRSQGYLLLWGSQSTLDAVEAIASCRRIVELSLMERDYVKWAAKFNPMVI